MKKAILIAAVILYCCTLANAQGNSARHNKKIDGCELRTDMRKLWENHIN